MKNDDLKYKVTRFARDNELNKKSYKKIQPDLINEVLFLSSF